MMESILRALQMAFAMGWEILWPLILGFALSAVVQAIVSHKQMSRVLPDDSPKSLAIASALGAASSSCSYAAVALARSVFTKGADFTAAMAFEVASTNLVAELSVILIVLMGWQFALAEFTGGPLMIVIIAVLFRIFLSRKLISEARREGDKGVKGSMEGHAEMDMSVENGRSLWPRLSSPEGVTATSHYFVMDVLAVWRDIVVGLLLAGVLAAWVPQDFWKTFFLTSHPVAATLWGPIIGPIVSVVSFVCSVGNIPLAAVLWNGGISFGGVIAFIYADLIILPIIDIYRKYYGWKVTAFIVGIFYVAMVGAALVIEFAFQLLGLIPQHRAARIVETSITFNYTTVLNIVFLALAAFLVVRFFRTGGRKMMAHMS